MKIFRLYFRHIHRFVPLPIVLVIIFFIIPGIRPVQGGSVTDSFTDTTKINTGSSSNYQVDSGVLKLGASAKAGTGADGDITITADKSINTSDSIANRTCDDSAEGGDAVNYSVTALTSNTATLESSPSANCLTAGDEVLLINLRGGGYRESLLHFDGNDGSTTFTDEGGRATWTGAGNAQIDTAQSVFGNSSLYLDGTGDYIYAADSDDWSLDYGDFTIDFRVRFTTLATTQTIISHLVTGVYGGFAIYRHTGGSLWMEIPVSGGGTNPNWAWTPSLNTWYHVAITRSGNSFRLFVNGSQVGSTFTYTEAVRKSAGSLYLGQYTPAAPLNLNGWLDEVRITKGVARWTANFTAPSSAHDISPYSTTNVGNYETLTIDSINSNVITFTGNKTNYYGVGNSDTGIGLTATDQAVMLQRVPQYNNVTLSNANTDFYPDAWSPPGGSAHNGNGEGGVMFFRAKGTVTIPTGTSIHANGLGYTGGTVSYNAGGGNGGESYCGTGGLGTYQFGNDGAGGGSAGYGAAGGMVGGYGRCGGGGGSVGAAVGQGSSSSGGAGGGGSPYCGAGGGAGYGSAGTGGAGNAGETGVTGGTNTSGNGGGATNYGGGGGGGTYGIASLTDLFFGSGGGAGGYTGGVPGGSGGRGGGIVYIAANTISMTSTGKIAANGSNGSNGSSNSGGGGGGSGGSVLIEGNDLTLGTSLVTALASSGGTGGGTGGAGGTGRIALYTTDLTHGDTSPTDHALANPTGYSTTGTIISTNLTNGLSVGELSTFVYNLSSIPSGTTARIQFSDNGTSWYNHSGTLDEYDTLSLGTDNSIDLSALTTWYTNFYYKVSYTSNGSTTPQLADITLNYVTNDACDNSIPTSISLYSSCSFQGRTDPDNGERIISGIDAGTGNTNTAVLSVKRGSLTVLSNETLVLGSISLSGGSIVINNGAIVRVGRPIWYLDADDDHYAASLTNFSVAAVAPSADHKRRNTITSLSVADCADNNASYNTQSSQAWYRDVDGDNYGVNSDTYTSCVQNAGYVGTGGDCYDSNANAKPGQTTCYAVHRGDTSFDYNCVSGQQLCTSYMSGSLITAVARCPFYGCANDKAIDSGINYVGCGQGGYTYYQTSCNQNQTQCNLNSNVYPSANVRVSSGTQTCI